MSDNDMLRRGALVKYIKTYECAKCSNIGLCGHCAVLTAPQEMTAREFLVTLARRSQQEGEPQTITVAATGFTPSAIFDRIIDDVERWAAEHPEKPEKKRKTYAEDFKGQCPNHLHHCGMPVVCRNEVYGFGGRCTVAEAAKRGGCSSCWNAEMEGEDE